MRIQNAVRRLDAPRGAHQRLLPAGLALATVAIVVVGLLAGLRAHQSRGSATPPAAPTPAAKGVLFVLDQAGTAGQNATVDSLRFVRPDGTLQKSVSFPDGPGARHHYETTVAGQVFYVSEQGRLMSVGSDGRFQDHGSVQAAQGWLFEGMVVRPDGQRWAWLEAKVDWVNNTSINTVRLHVAGTGLPPRVLLDETIQGSAEALLAWTERGILLGHSGVGIGGFIPFTAWASPRLVDPQSGTARPLADCQGFEDLGRDGGYTCDAPDSNAIDVFDPAGHLRRHIVVADPVYLYGGAVLSPDGARVAIGVVENNCGGDNTCRWRTDLVDVASGRITHPGGDNQVSVTWLSDGSLVLRNGVTDDIEVLGPGGAITHLGVGGYIGTVEK